MLLYFIPSIRRYVRTQGEAKKMAGDDFKIVDVPVDKDGLMEFLNLLWGAFDIDLGNKDAEQFKELVDDTEALIARANCMVVETEQEAKAVLETGTGVAVCGDPPELPDYKPVKAAPLHVSLDVEDAIHNATPQQLATYMECLAGRVKEFARGLR